VNTDTPAANRLPAFRIRHYLVLAAFVGLGAGLVWRVADLQLTRGDFLQRQGDARHLRRVAVPAHRGNILDRNGAPLAVSTPVDSVWANPATLARVADRWDELAETLGLDAARLRKVAALAGQREFIYLRRRIPPDVAARVAALAIPGINLQREYRRYYPMAEAAAQLIGFTNVDDAGQEGMELARNDWLHGEPGARRVLRDRKGLAVENVELLREPRPGRDLTLTIDRRMQYLAYRALLSGVRSARARSGSVVVLDVRSGEVLAIANQPSFNPNNLHERAAATVRNRALTDVFEPGSTAKPFTISAALTSGRFSAASIIDTNPGTFKVGRLTVHDARNYGRIDLATVIAKSSNVGASHVALALEPRMLWDVLSRAGFGHRSSVGFPGEAAGVLSHFSEWGEVERATLSYGYGFSVNALQLARAYAALARDGTLPAPSLVRGERPAAAAMRVVPASVAATVRSMLEGVVAPGGTGRRAAIPGYRVGGKTGTVRKPVPGGYAKDRYTALFAGMAPMSDPRLVAVVVIDEPDAKRYYGGQVAAPVFAQVMGAALRLIGAAPDASGVEVRRVAVGPRSALAVAALEPGR